MQEAAKRIMTLNPDIRITVAGGGSGVGVKQVGEGLVEIGNTGRPLKAEEVEKYGLKTFPFAIDGVAVVVRADLRAGRGHLRGQDYELEGSRRRGREDKPLRP